MNSPAEKWTGLIQGAALAVQANIEELTELDSVVGDGDHGVNLARGLKAASEQLNGSDSPTVSSVLQTTGSALQESMAGTAGLLLGRFFAVAARAADDRFDASTIATVLRTGTDEVIKRGKAAVGDRSMVDALEPAAAAAGRCSAEGASAGQTLRAAATAARSGAVGTSSLTPRVGRAARAADKPTGRPDAGATSVAILLETWADAAMTGEETSTKGATCQHD